jgi:hypothetical protein
MYISPCLAWIEPYLDAAKPIVPKLKKVSHILTRTPNIKQLQHSQAHIVHISEKDEYKITINSCYFTLEKIKPVERKKRFYSQIDILSHLAHEIAHLNYWDHTPDHKALECRLTEIFMYMLKAQGYHSEEKEFKSKN